MSEYSNGFAGGIRLAYDWYKIRIRQNKWWIIPFVVDVVFFPFKLVIALLVYKTRRGHEMMNNFYEEILEEVEEG